MDTFREEQGIVMVKTSNTFLHLFYKARNDHCLPRSKSAPPTEKRRQESEPLPLYVSPGFDSADSLEFGSEMSAQSGSCSESNQSIRRHKNDDRDEFPTEQSISTANYEHWEEWMDKEDFYNVMIRNIPCSCKRNDIEEAIQELGFQDKHDFFYVPTRHGKTRGFAFLGFPDASLTREFVRKMTGYKFPGKASPKFISVVPANLQGFRNNFTHFRSACVMKHKDAPVFRNHGPSNLSPVGVQAATCMYSLM
jgi:hypothetical protein